MAMVLPSGSRATPTTNGIRRDCDRRKIHSVRKMSHSFSVPSSLSGSGSTLVGRVERLSPLMWLRMVLSVRPGTLQKAYRQVTFLSRGAAPGLC